MESRRFLLAIVLMVAVIVGTNLLFGPARVQPPVEGQPADTAQAAATGEARPTEAPARPATVPEAGVAQAPVVGADTVIIESPLFRYGISTNGAGVVRAELRQFESYAEGDGAVQLVPEEARALIGYRIAVGERVIDLGSLRFEPEQAGPVSLAEGDAPRTVEFVHADPAGEFVARVAYTFDPDEYVIGVRVTVGGLGGATPRLLIDMGPTLAVNEANAQEDQRSLAYVVNSRRDGIRSVPLRDVKADRIEEGPLEWVALKNKYFLAAVLAGDGEDQAFGGVIARDAAGEFTTDLTATLPAGSGGAFDFRIYLGPQQYERLAALGDGLQDVNPYGWRPLRPIIRPLGHAITWALVSMHRTLGLGYGWVLILFGVLIRIILWPLNARAMRTQMKNMALQPRLQEIQQKYKNDPEKLQREMLRLYREEGFSPFGGCLPMLIPFPVLITLFFVFQNTIEFRGVEFLWLPDLSRPDPYHILPLLLGGSMFLMQRISAKATPPNPQMKMMMYFMPAFMTFIFLNFASGLNLYYTAQNLASIPQQIQLTRERQRQQQQSRSRG